MAESYQWVSREAVRAIHRRQIAEHGGLDGVRDESGLSSALARPRNIHAYDDGADVFALAAAYGFGLVRNHPFSDGNKRTGYIVMRLFLKLNGVDIHVADEHKYMMVMQLAAGEMEEPALAGWLRKYSYEITS